MNLTLPEMAFTSPLDQNKKRLFIGAYGFESRTLGWISAHIDQGEILTRASMINYLNPKGCNKKEEIKRKLESMGASLINEISYDVKSPHNIEDSIQDVLERDTHGMDEVIVDTSSMTKLAILVTLCKLSNFSGAVRIVYSEAEEYAPTEDQYNQNKDAWASYANSPSRGVESIIRMRCLSSIRMQGQPVVLVAFTSFNEQLIKQLLATISPFRLILINGRPPRIDFIWREKATQEIHEKRIEEYYRDNPIGANELLINSTSTLDYRETYSMIQKIYSNNGSRSRLIFAATGSKMQTVGLFFSKMRYPDIHIEYLTPDSYFEDVTKGVRAVHEVTICNFSEFIGALRTSKKEEFEQMLTGHSSSF